MKYFTPQRYLRMGNLDNERAFLAAQEDWERAITAYKAHLESIHKQLPRGLWSLVRSVYQHDARVLGVWEAGADRLTITLQPESTPGQLAVITYTLAGRPSVKANVLPPEVRSEPVAWLYDELHAEPAGGKNGGATFRHDILLSNGWQVHVRARGASVARPKSFLPAAGDKGGRVSRSA